MNKHINKNRLANETAKKPIIGITLSNGINRHQKRAQIAIDRKMPGILKKSKVDKNIKETKEAGRKVQLLKLNNRENNDK